MNRLAATILLASMCGCAADSLSLRDSAPARDVNAVGTGVIASVEAKVADKVDAKVNAALVNNQKQTSEELKAHGDIVKSVGTSSKDTVFMTVLVVVSFNLTLCFCEWVRIKHGGCRAP